MARKHSQLGQETLTCLLCRGWKQVYSSRELQSSRMTVPLDMDEQGEYDYYAPRDWQRFYMGYQERFVDDCVLNLQVGTQTWLDAVPGNHGKPF